MSTEMELFKGGIPAHLSNYELDETTKALMGGGTSGKRISIRGSVFRMIVDGKEVAKNDNRTMNMVFVAAAPNVSRQYYSGTYVEGETVAPTCYSNDGKIPEPDGEEVQSKTCATCPQNIKGSGKTGGRACGFLQRTAVVLENDIGGDIYQLSLPSMSIFGDNKDGKMTMQGYAKFLGGHGLPITTVVTEARFDTDASVPKLTFKAIRPLTVEEIALVQEQGSSEDAQRAIRTTASTLDGGSPKKAVETKSAPPEAPPKEEPSVEEKQPVKRAQKKVNPVPAPVIEIPTDDVDDILDEELDKLADWDD